MGRRHWPLTGRAEEMAFLTEATLGSQRPRGVVLAGAAGVGKTRLARELFALAGQCGLTTRWVTATESAARVPFAAFSAVLGDTAMNPTRVIREAAHQLGTGDRSSGVFVVVDDAHLLDPMSALLVHHLVQWGIATVAITVRTGDRAPDAITATWKDGALDRLEVQPLSEFEAGSLVESALGGPVDTFSARRIWGLTRGNALFLRQLVDGEADAQRLHLDDGVWRWRGGPILTPQLSDLVGARMGRLSRSLCEVVDNLALCEPLDLEILRRLTDPRTIERAEQRGLVHVRQEGPGWRVMLAHPLFGEARRADMGNLRAHRMRGRIAQAIGRGRSPSPVDTLRQAVLALNSDLEPDAKLFITAARTASDLVDLVLAERLSRAAVAAGAGSAGQLILSFVLSFQGRGAEAEAIFAELAAHADDEFARSVISVTRAANLLWPMRNPNAAAEVLTASEHAVNEQASRHALQSMRAALDTATGHVREGVDAASMTLRSPSLPPTAVMLATYGLVAGLGVLGRADEIDAAAARGYAETDQAPEVAFLRVGLAFMHVDGLRLAGYLHRAETLAMAQREVCSQMPGPAMSYGIALAAQAALAQGRVDPAVQLLRQVRATASPADTQGFGFVCLLSLIEALALAGEPDAALHAWEKVENEKHPAFEYLSNRKSSLFRRGSLQPPVTAAGPSP